MGGRGSKAPSGGDARNGYGNRAAGEKTSQATRPMRTVNKAAVDNWIDSTYA